MKSRLQEQGSAAHVIIVTVLVIALLGALGFIFWQNFIQKDEMTTTDTAAVVDTPELAEPCGGGADELGSNGVFCSERFGVTFNVPEQFKGQLKATENVPIYPVSDVMPEAIGTTEKVVSATVSQGEYDYTLTASLLPQINSMSLGLVAAGQFDATDKKVYAFTSSNSGGFQRAGEYTYETKNGVKVYRDTYGDVGTMMYTNAVITDNKVVVISLKASPKNDQGLPNEAAPVNDSVILESIKLVD